jgi:hypothetical protein
VNMRKSLYALFYFITAQIFKKIHRIVLLEPIFNAEFSKNFLHTDKNITKNSQGQTIFTRNIYFLSSVRVPSS